MKSEGIDFIKADFSKGSWSIGLTVEVQLKMHSYTKSEEHGRMFEATRENLVGDAVTDERVTLEQTPFLYNWLMLPSNQVQ